MSPYYRWDGDDLILSCRLQPKASSDELVGPHGEQFRIRITAPPVDGKANRHLTKFLASEFGVSNRQVVLESGDHGRSKVLRICSPKKIPAKLDIKSKIQS
ncbi:MAG: DUF167 family protein [Ketobacteraceae bacterium]|nr:DUF167 family protein [Ketobacteraceae bacterium]